MIKTVTIPDLHGKDVWKQINPDNFDRIIFLGDYVDDFDKTDTEILYNLNEIILFKDKYPDKVVLLVGNHDIPYIYYRRNPSQYRNVLCSGHRESMRDELAKLYDDNFDKFKLMYQIDNIVWSHAGLTQEAYNEYYKNKFDGKLDIFVEEMNKFFILNMDENLNNVSRYRGGWNRYGSIMWTDIREWNMATYQLPFNQIVGHHKVDDITVEYSENEFIKPPRFIVHTDVLDTRTRFFQHDIGE